MACGAACSIFAALVISTLCLSIWPRFSLAQQVAPAGGPVQAAANAGDEEPVMDGVFLPPDRSAKRRLEVAREMLADGRYGEAARLLGSLLEGPEDYFFKPDPGENVYRSLKSEAGRLIGSMPADGLNSYELQFGAQARRLLSEAAPAGDIAGITEVARRFFYTKAGQEAMLLVGRRHLDHGRPLAAALCLERISQTPGGGQRFEPLLSLTLATSWSRAELPDKARQTLARFKSAWPQDEVQIGDRSVRLFNDPKDSLAWLSDKAGVARSAPREVALSQWTMARGDAERNASTSGGQPLMNCRWSRLTAEDNPSFEKIVGQLRQTYEDQDVAALPSMQPLAVGDVVLMRAVDDLLAVDFTTGKLIWTARSLADRSYEQIASPRNGEAPQLRQGLEQRMWDDAIYGNLSSDGAQVFAIEDLPLQSGLNGAMNNVNGVPQRRVIFPLGRQIQGSARNSNRLTARELKTEGKLKWSVGGPSGDDEPKLAGAFFLGPPLPLQGHLYVLAEMKGQEIRLLALSGKTGQLEWSQQLAMVELSIQSDSVRRSAGAVPSFADGILVCPTAAGAVVAVDLTTRSLLWGYQYPRQQIAFNRFMFNGVAPVNAGGDRSPADRWVDGTAIIVDGRVLISPVEDDKLYCLNLVDGHLLWKVDRTDGERASYLYVACASQGKAILVGHRQLTAVRLSDGQVAWGPLELPAGASPSGRGFLSGGDYYLPLSNAEIVQIDLGRGAIVGRARSRHGETPGNLICHRGDVISQNVDFIATYPQLAPLKKQVEEALAKRPDDPAAIAQAGEVALDEGRLNDAIDLLRRSFTLKPDDNVRELLAESLLAGLNADFAAHRQQAAELEGLLSGDQQQAAYMRAMAVGLEKVGDSLAAFDRFVALAADERSLEKLETLGDSLVARRDRWIRQHLADLWDAANEESRQNMRHAIEARLVAAGADPSPEALERLLNLFGSLPAADSLRQRLAQKLAGPDSLLKREQLLLRLESSDDASLSHWASAQLAMLMQEARRPELAAIYYRKLGGALADVDCLNGQTGKSLVEALPVNSPVRLALAEPKPFPSGVVDERPAVGKGLNNARAPRPVEVELHGDPGPFFHDLNFALDDRQTSLLAKDGLGVERFRVSFAEAAKRGVPQQTYLSNNNAFSHVSAYGNEALIWLGHTVKAVDTLRKDGASNRVLWSADLQVVTPGMSTGMGIHQRQINVPWGQPKSVPQYSFGRVIGTLGPASDLGVAFQRFRDLVTVDPLSGEELWVRKGLPLGCEVFGDDEVVIAAPAEGGEALVVRRIDGELLGKRVVPPLENRMATFGRRMLTWTIERGKPIVRLVDPWLKKTIWSRELEPESRGALAGREMLGLFEAGGRFSLVRVSDGVALVDREKVASERALLDIHVMPMENVYLLMTNTPATGSSANESNISPAPGGILDQLVNGRLYGFDRLTGKRIWGPIKIEMQGLHLRPPTQLPAIAFVRHVQTNGQQDTKTSALCVDVRNGRKVYENDKVLPQQITNFEVVGDRNAGTMALQFPNRTITLVFTDKPLPAEPPVEAPRKKNDAAKAVGERLRDVIEGAIEPLKPKAEEKIDDD
jgi:outer membrane protein assembly factor BamB/tetratricopeptide (TPR) repeat protein